MQNSKGSNSGSGFVRKRRKNKNGKWRHCAHSSAKKISVPHATGGSKKMLAQFGLGWGGGGRYLSDGTNQRTGMHRWTTWSNRYNYTTYTRTVQTNRTTTELDGQKAEKRSNDYNYQAYSAIEKNNWIFLTTVQTQPDVISNRTTNSGSQLENPKPQYPASFSRKRFIAKQGEHYNIGTTNYDQKTKPIIRRQRHICQGIKTLPTRQKLVLCRFVSKQFRTQCVCVKANFDQKSWNLIICFWFKDLFTHQPFQTRRHYARSPLHDVQWLLTTTYNVRGMSMQGNTNSEIRHFRDQKNYKCVKKDLKLGKTEQKKGRIFTKLKQIFSNT